MGVDINEYLPAAKRGGTVTTTTEQAW